MQLLSINVGEVQPIENAKSGGLTGIYKIPAQGPVAVTTQGLAGDNIVDVKHHGGPDQAVYLYSREDYDWWAGVLNREMPAGIFGENLTVAGFQSAERSIGDRFEIGSVLLEVTAPRIPCVTLAARMGDSQFVKKFRDGERPGLYCRVLEEGTLTSGLPVTLKPLQDSPLSIIEMFREHYRKTSDPATIRRFLEAPIAIRARRQKEEQLAALEAA